MTNADKKLIQSLSPSIVHILLAIADLLKLIQYEQKRYVEEITKSDNN